MKRALGFILICILLVSAGFAQKKQSGHKPFKVYAFIPYAGYVQNGAAVPTNFKQMQAYLAGLGIAKYNLIYESRIAEYPDGDKTHGVINRDKLDPIAKQASAEPGVIVALDLEGWNRFDVVHTPPKLIDAIKAFKATYPTAQVGLYATVPQDTYGYPKDTTAYNKLNRGYSEVAAAVDYFSPSLYNYKTTDNEEWKKGAVYNIEACRKYGYPEKKILPYITAEIKLDGKKNLLDYNEMMYRLQTLYDLAADGCLIWGSSGIRDAQGNRIIVNEDEGWLKAVKDFMKQHP